MTEVLPQAMSKRQRLAWFAAVTFVAVMGIGNLAIWIGQSMSGSSWWGIDAVAVEAARRLVAGEPLYLDSGGATSPPFVYPPFAALLAMPLTVLEDEVAVALLAAGKFVVTVLCVRWLTVGWAAVDRLMAFIALVLSLPYLHDLFLGNTNIFIVAAMVPAIFGGPRIRNGIPLGLAAAAFGKPLILPVLIWLLIWRRPTFAGSLITMVAATLASLLLLGPGVFADWVTIVRQSSEWLSTPFAGNHGVTSLVPEMWAPIALITALGLAIVLWRRGPRTSLAWAVTSGILLAPYAGTYAALPVALAVPAIGPLAPWFALAIVATSPIGTTIPLPFYAGAILVGSLGLRETLRQSRSDGRVGLQASGH